MSKKSYKKLQNRLYREIKRRIQAEQWPKTFVNYTVTHPKIDTIKVKRIFNRLEMATDGEKEFVDYVMEHCLMTSIAKQLFYEGYVQCYSEMDHNRDAITVECQLKVCRPDEYGSKQR